MGCSSSKQDVVANLAELEQKEKEMNLQIKEMQERLNGMVPKDEQIKVNQNLTPNSKINNDNTSKVKSSNLKKKKNIGESSKKSKGKGVKKNKK